MWARDLAFSVSQLKTIRLLLSRYMMLTVYDSGKPEARHQLVEATTGIQNEIECIQWQNSMAKKLGACMQYDGGHAEHVF
jgi:hypothetical protein